VRLALPRRGDRPDRAGARDGQPVWLVTGAAESTATAIADHLGLFDRVFHSTDAENLTSSRKRDRLGVDLRRWQDLIMPATAVTIWPFLTQPAAPSSLRPMRLPGSGAQRNQAEFLPLAQTSPLAILKSIRVHQWLKNVLIAVPLVLNHEFADTNLVMAAIAAFFSFSFPCLAVYIVNDISDLANDRQHPRKRLRPLASGAVSVPVISATAAALLDGFGWACKPAAAAVLGRAGLYAVITTAYTFVLKRKLLVDVFTLAALYTLRIVAGAAATGHRAVILAACLFDLLLPQPGAGQALCRARRTCRQATDRQLKGRSYVGADKDMIGQAGIASAFSAAMVLALYVDSDEVTSMYAQPWLLWPLCPLILYMQLRIWILARRSQMHDDPVVFIMRDWRSQVTTFTGAALVILATLKLW
jgi:4-hydroxybenzoate polyprenyltransferase